MDFLAEVERTIGVLPDGESLFHALPGGLRLDLSGERRDLGGFVIALDRGREILASVFAPDDEAIAVFQHIVRNHRTRLQPDDLAALYAMHIEIPEDATYRVVSRGIAEPDMPDWNHVTAGFELAGELVSHALWGAAASGFRSCNVEPRLHLDAYLAHTRRQVLVRLFHDGAMDIVGPNHAELARLYERWGPYVRSEERKVIDVTFARFAQLGANKPDIS